MVRDFLDISEYSVKMYIQNLLSIISLSFSCNVRKFVIDKRFSYFMSSRSTKSPIEILEGSLTQAIHFCIYIKIIFGNFKPQQCNRIDH